MPGVRDRDTGPRPGSGWQTRGLGGEIEREPVDVGADLALAGEFEYLDQLDRAASVRDGDRGVKGQRAEPERECSAREADDLDLAGEAEAGPVPGR